METTPVEAGQWRRAGNGYIVWAVLEPDPHRRGFWHIVGHESPFHIECMGRRELEALSLVDRDYFGGRQHPGEQYVRGFRAAILRQVRGD